LAAAYGKLPASPNMII